jgi:radical SAM superfamily enzyme YgiQ (UPF0313 family)
MRILITNPPWIIREGQRQRIGVRAGSRWPFSYLKPGIFTRFRSGLKKLVSAQARVSSARPYVPYPLFMGYAASFLQGEGIEAIFYDAVALGHSYSVFYKEVKRLKPDIVIQETSTPSFDIDLKIAEALHKQSEVCLVGPHATAFAEQIIKLPFVDYILKGEYEYSSLEMVKTRRKGIYEAREVNDLDALPYPYRDKVVIQRYSEPCCRKKLSYPQLWVYAGRGCAFQCNFCLWVNTMYNKRLVLRQPEKVLAEIDDMVRKYNFKYILFDDDCWNLGPHERLMQLADGLKKIGLPWSILCRLDTSTKEMFGYFVDRGCVGLRLGVESLSQSLLDRMDKKLKVGNIIDTINYLKTPDVSLYLCFMHYLPGETEEDRREQEEKIKALGLVAQNPPCVPFPGTPYYKSICRQGFNLEKTVAWSEYDGGNIGKNLLKVIKEYSQRVRQ